MKKIIFLFFILSSFLRAQSDCQSAISICGNSGISYTPSGHGTINETLQGCVSSEHYTVWYQFTVATAGTLTFVITPNASNDYDWTLFGPNATCSNLGPAIRCSYASPSSGCAGTYLTGLNMTATDVSEGACGGVDGFVKYLDVLPGQTYYLMVDNFSQSTNGFSLTWGGTATLASPFNDPTLTPNPFIAPGPNHDGQITICNPNFDFSTLTPGILNGNPNFVVNYYTNTNDAIAGTNPIIGSIPVTVGSTYIYTIQYHDATNPNNPVNNCKNFGNITFVSGVFTVSNATLTECSNYNFGTATYDLTSVQNSMYAGAATVHYYPSLADLQNNTNEITIPQQYVSAANQIFVKFTNPYGCTNVGTINLQTYPKIVVQDAEIRECFITDNPTNGLFNLTLANVGTGIKKYYHSVQDAIDGVNEIMNPTAYSAPEGVVYVKVTNGNGCYNIAKILLHVTTQAFSPTLVDKVICTEDTTNLDAGPGYTTYEWSTGATTQAITNVGVGTYWVKLKKDGCVTKQTVKVIPAEIPVITNVEIANNVTTVFVTGGHPPYKYSLDNVVWQDSNVLNTTARGKNTIYVKDSYDCEPVITEITVPNLINVITANNDGINDVIDYSALAYKEGLDFSVFDRYGSKVYTATKANGYKWDGKLGSRKLPTGTYWYYITWKENDAKKTPVKFSGWIMIKNRD